MSKLGELYKLANDQFRRNAEAYFFEQQRNIKAYHFNALGLIADVNGAKFFDTIEKPIRPLSVNHNPVKNLVKALNYPFRRQAKLVEEYKEEYKETLKASNVCYICYRPLRIKSAPVIHYRPHKALAQMFTDNPDLLEAELKLIRERWKETSFGFDDKQAVSDLVSSSKRIKKYSKYHSASNLFESIEIKSYHYAECKSYFRPFTLEGRYWFGLVCYFDYDRPNLPAHVLRFNPNSDSMFYDISDGALVHYAPASFRVEASYQCQCK